LNIANTQVGSSPFDSRITQLAKDSDGNVIVVSRLGEVNILSSPESAFKFVPIGSPYSPQNFVYSLCGSSDGKGLWIGSDNGINFYDLSTGNITKPAIPGLNADAVSSITTYGNMLWIGTAQNGLYLHDLASGNTKHFQYQENVPYSIMSDEITDVFVSSKGETFVLTQWGIGRYDYEKSDFYTFPEIGQQTHVITMAEDNEGRLWAATINNGLFYRKPGETRFQPFESSVLDKSTVTIMLLGRNGTFWLATQEDGIFKFDKTAGDFRKFEIPMLTKRSISAMEEDTEGNLWIASGKAIVQVTKDGKVDFNSSRILFRTPVLRSSTALQDGQIAIGCSGGVQFFAPPAMHQKDGKVTTLPSGITFPFMTNDEETLETLGINVLLYTKDKITLPFDHNTFTIHLAANHPADLPDVNYDYMLEGVDKDWTLGTAQSQVTYNNIPPGTYHFLVKPSGLSDAETTVLTIRISPPWYLSTWAYIAYGVLIILFGVLVWYIVRRIVRNHYNKRIESVRAQKEQEAWQSKMRFFVDLVHEIRTPLMLISLPLEYLSKKIKEFQPGDDNSVIEVPDGHIRKSRRYLLSMQNNLDYLLGITNQLLDFRQVDNNEVDIKLNITACNLNQMLTLLCKRFEEPMLAENKQIDLNLPTDDVIAYIDADKTERMLMNLVGNARKYCNSKVDVTLSVKNGNARISISDDGTGIPESERNNIFKRYYQIKGDNIATSLGTGLGLAYAKRISTLHNGDIKIKNSVNGGADFVLTLPLGNPADLTNETTTQFITTDTSSDKPVAIDKNTDNENSSSEKDSDIQDNTVLVVDDNSELLEMICEGLDSNYNVIKACDGIEALEILKDNDVDFIVSDVMMPRMDGIELLKKVKNDINTSHIPFIILTAKTSPEARREGLTEGADVYLDKPFSIAALMMQIENIRRTRNFFYARRKGSEPLPVVEEAVIEAVKEEKLPAINKY
ncbi:MAG: response regulator, partial [Muribaculaceae bacterium]|nr:response regulator [Muribaculaceae bacterium]